MLCMTLFPWCLIAIALARPNELNEVFEPVQLKSQAQPDITELQEYLGPEGLSRKKKNVVTTFCVEIRPSDQKPFQVCEPMSDKGEYNNQGSYYPQRHYGSSEHLKYQESEHSETHVKPAYTAPVKTYESPESNSVSVAKFRSTNADDEPIEIESRGAGSAAAKSEINDLTISNPSLARDIAKFRSTKADDEPIEIESRGQDSAAAKSEIDDLTIPNPSLARETIKSETQEKEIETPSKSSETIPSDIAVLENTDKPSNDETKVPENEATKKIEPEALKRTNKESAEESENGNESQMRLAHHQRYGTPYASTYHVPHPTHHNGLVITCQPNLAGYSHGLPPGYHESHYRTANGEFRNHYQYQPHPQMFGNYKPYPPKPIYKTQYTPGYRPQPRPYNGHSFHPSKPHSQLKPEYFQPGFSPSYQPPQDYYPPSPRPHNKDYDVPETYFRSSEVLEEVHTNMNDDKPMENEKERHTMEKIEDLSKQRLEEKWIPEGMEEIISEPSAIEKNSGIMASKEIYDPIPDVSRSNGHEREAEIVLPGPDVNNNAEKPIAKWRNADPAAPEELSQGNFREADGYRDAEQPIAPMEMPQRGWREADGGPWRNAENPLVPVEHAQRDWLEDTGGRWRDAEAGRWRNAEDIWREAEERQGVRDEFVNEPIGMANTANSEKDEIAENKSVENRV